jgi:tetratricopeptide (TPR) repeat protein
MATDAKGIVVRISIIVFVVLASAVAGYYAVRNTVASRLDFLFVAQAVNMSEHDATRLEEELKSDPNSFADTIKLLAYYSFKSIQGGLNADQLTHRRERILWVINNEPASPFAGSFEASFNPPESDSDGIQQGKALWLKQVQSRPRDYRVISNASEFFSWAGDWERSKELAEHAYAINPKDHDVASSLASLYWRSARHASNSEEVRRSAARAFLVYKRALDDAGNASGRFNDLPNAAQAAFEAGEYQQSESLSREALNLAVQPEHVSNNADAIHYSNIVLGRLALRCGDVSAASAYLLKAGDLQPNSSPHLDTFGPNMMLADELLQKGERDAVLRYFDQCAKFWTMDEGKLASWRFEVRAGKKPDFGANLRY